MTRTTEHRHPVVVVGARVAGATTALLLARQGHDVLVVDRAAMPSDTLSSHGLFRPGVVQLARLGLLDAVVASGAPQIRDVTFHAGDLVLRKTVEDLSGVDFLIAPRRHLLDQLVLDAAIAAGARFESGLSVTGIWTDDTGRVAGVRTRSESGVRRRIPASFVVGADGLRSRIAAAVEAPVVEDRGPHGATHYAYVAGLDAVGYELHIADGILAGVFPTHGGEANVWVCVGADAEIRAADRREAFVDLLATASPVLAERVRAARFTSPVRGAVRLPNQVRAAAGRGWALVGDAGYHRDPITGHGITDALHHAELLAEALDPALRGDVDERLALMGYWMQRDAAIAQMLDVTVALGAFPPVPEFLGLEKQLERLLEAEAASFAARPPIRSLVDA